MHSFDGRSCLCDLIVLYAFLTGMIKEYAHEGIFRARSPYFCVAVRNLRRRRGSGYGSRRRKAATDPRSVGTQRVDDGTLELRVSSARAVEDEQIKRRASMRLIRAKFC